jgi:hypothetical protein
MAEFDILWAMDTYGFDDHEERNIIERAQVQVVA